MNCPSRTDELPRSDGLNQNPNALSNDLTTNQDLNGLANARRLRRSVSPPIQSAGLVGSSNRGGIVGDDPDIDRRQKTAAKGPTTTRVGSVDSAFNASPAGGSARLSRISVRPSSSNNGNVGGGTLDAGGRDGGARRKGPLWKVVSSLRTFYRFVGPGFIVSVAYSISPHFALFVVAFAGSYVYCSLPSNNMQSTPATTRPTLRLVRPTASSYSSSSC